MLLPELSGDELFDSVALEAKAKAISAEGARYIAIDLSPLDYIYSDTINKIIGINRSLVSVEGRLVIVAPHPKVIEILHRAGVDKQIKIVETLDELASLSQAIQEMETQSSAKEEIVEEIEEPEDDFADLKNILAESLTIGDSFDSEPVAKKIPPIEPTKPIEPEQTINVDDLFVTEEKPTAEKIEPAIEEIKEEAKIEEEFIPIEKPESEIIDAEPHEEIELIVEEKVAPVVKNGEETEIKIETTVKEEEKFVPNEEIELAVQNEQPKIQQQSQSQQPEEIKPSEPIVETTVSNPTIQKDETPIAPKVTFDSPQIRSFKPHKKADFTKIILILIILLLFAVVTALLTGIFPLNSKIVEMTPEQPAVVQDEQPTPVFDEPAKPAAEEVKEVSAPAPVVSTPASAPKKTQTAKPQAKKSTTTAKPKATVSADMISVSTTPAGALIFMNNDYFGKSPINIPKPPYGTIVVRAELSGFETHEWNIDFDGGKRNLTKKLTRKSAAQPVQTQQQSNVQQQQQQQLAAQQEAQRKAAAEQAAREQTAREEAARQQLLQQQQQEVQRKAAVEQAAKDEAARKVAAEQAAQQEAQRKAAAEQAARDEAARKAAAEQAAREEAARKAAEEEAARKAAEAAQEAEIFFNSMPPRAEIFLNGQKIGETNIAPVKVKPGTYNLEFKKDGKSGTWSGTLKNGKNPSALIRLQ